MPPAVAGLTIVAFATSSPELAVSLQASLSGQADVAVGNVVGSNIANILLILGLSALVAPLIVSRRLVLLDVPLMIGVSLLMYAVALDGTISQVEGIDLYGRKFLDDYPRYTAASAIAETAERFTPVEREPSLRLFLLTLGAMRALAGREHASTLVLDAYLLRGMALAGWAPALTECAVCGTRGQHRAFSVPAGGCVCQDCRPPGAAHPAPATLDLMTALADGDWRVAEVAEVASRKECSGLVAAHLQWHLERGLRSLPLVDRSVRD